MVINGSTKLFGVIGNPISHSLSPIMHNAAFKALGINALYMPCHISPEHLSFVVNAIKTFNFQGINVTIPFKQTIIPFLDEIDGDSNYTRSVNTLFNKNGHICGTSTDGIGFIRSLREDGDFDPKDKNVILLGAGGSAYALAYHLVKTGVSSLVCYNRNITNAQKLKADLFTGTTFELEIFSLHELATKDLSDYDLLINTTSVGLSDDQTLISYNQFHSKLFVYDIVYKKGGSRLFGVA